MSHTKKTLVVWLAIVLIVFAVGCKKKVAPPPPPPPPAAEPAPPPPPPAAPVARLSVEPGSIQRGQSANLTWTVTGQATSITISQGLGTVQANGTQRVQPADSTTYTLTATGPGGTNTSSATVNVTTPPPPPPPPAPAPRATIEQRLSAEVRDVFFDYDKSDVRADARDILTRNADALKSILAEFANSTIIVEGHCDERGSAEYNLGLGDRRASSAKEFLTQLGLPAERLRTISYGKERPQCTESSDACLQQNRRVHFSPGQ